ncbi:MAG: hypothetical protein DHS20C01_09810 [marine bacterium B5-7]|nr:MAG: hypothetical protein DHS20C01_09810 [marine bacterium B5-7]
MKKRPTLFALLLALSPAMLHADDAGNAVKDFQYKSALQASQDAIGRQVSTWPLTDADGMARSFAGFRGKPLILSLVFTSCHSICPTTTRYLAGVIEKAREALGPDTFNVAVLGFDAANDSPLAMKQFAQQQGIDEDGWHVLSADAKTIKGLTDELGFEFFGSPSGFDHVVQATVIDANGRIYRQVYGEVFSTPLLIDPLMELVLNRPQPQQSFLDSVVDKIKFFCTAYDPARDGYFFDYSLFLELVIGAVVILGIIAFLIRELVAGRRLGNA